MLTHAQPKEASPEEVTLGFSILSYLRMVERFFPGILAQLSKSNENQPETSDTAETGAEPKQYTTHQRLFHLQFGIAKTQTSPLTEFNGACTLINKMIAQDAYKPIFKELHNAINALTPQLDLATIQQVFDLQTTFVTALLTETHAKELDIFLQRAITNTAIRERTQQAINRAIFFRSLSHLFQQTTSSPKQTSASIKKTNEMKHRQTFLMQMYATECETAEDVLKAMLTNTKKRIISQLETDNLVNIFEGKVKLSNKHNDESTESIDESLESAEKSLALLEAEPQPETTETPNFSEAHFDGQLKSLAHFIESMKSRYEYNINPSLVINLILSHHITIIKYLQMIFSPSIANEIKSIASIALNFIQSNLTTMKNNEENLLTSMVVIKTLKEITITEESLALTKLQDQIEPMLKKLQPARPELARTTRVADFSVFKKQLKKLSPKTSDPTKSPLKK